MPKCRENRRARLRRRRREERRLPDVRVDASQFEDDDDAAWLCDCGHFEESGLHCSSCGREPPWGCDCGQHDEYEEEYDESDYYEDLP